MSKEKLKNKIHTSHFAHHTSNRGITLIALIITIIVMLILTGVTLSITLGDNGLVNKAKEATMQTQIAMDRELLLSAVVGAIGIDGKVNFSEIVLPEGFTGSNGTYISKNGHTFTVNENGEISYTGSDNVIENGGDEPSVDEPTAFRWENLNLNVDTKAEYKGYIQPLDMTAIVSFLEDGRMIIHEGGGIIEIDAKDEKNIDKETGNLNFTVQLVKGVDTNIVATMNGENIDADTQGIGVITYVKQEKTMYTNEEVLKILGIENSTGTYNGSWMVIGIDENGNKKLVSTRQVGQYTLGYDDPRAVEAVSIAGTEATEEEKLQRCIWSYKNIENSLNAEIQEVTGIDIARSIKIEDIEMLLEIKDSDKGTEFGREYKYYYNTETSSIHSKYKTGIDTWSESVDTVYTSHTVINDDGETVIIDSIGDEVTLTNTYYNYRLTEDILKKMGRLAYRNYLLASPSVKCDVEYKDSNSLYLEFVVQYMENDKNSLSSGTLFTSYGNVNNYTGNIMAIVSIPNL